VAEPPLLTRDARPGRVVVDAAAIARRIDEMAGEVAAEARDPQDPLVLVGVLKGSLLFTADLMRALAAHGVPVELEMVVVRSYAGATESAGSVELVKDVTAGLRGRDVLIVEDVVDTGLTTAFLIEHLARQAPRRLRLAALLDKAGRRRRPVDIDYRGFVVGAEFLVGYGLDLGERWRELPDVHTLEPRQG